MHLCCSAYKSTIQCIQNLKKDCPRQIVTIDKAFINLEGAQEELSELCRDDKIYEGRCFAPVQFSHDSCNSLKIYISH